MVAHITGLRCQIRDKIKASGRKQVKQQLPQLLKSEKRDAAAPYRKYQPTGRLQQATQRTKNHLDGQF